MTVPGIGSGPMTELPPPHPGLPATDVPDEPPFTEFCGAKNVPDVASNVIKDRMMVFKC
jgi:hypothetical protein